MVEIIKTIFQNEIFIKKVLNLIIIDSFSKIGNGQVVENIFIRKISYDSRNFNHFQKIGKKR